MHRHAAVRGHPHVAGGLVILDDEHEQQALTELVTLLEDDPVQPVPGHHTVAENRTLRASSIDGQRDGLSTSGRSGRTEHRGCYRICYRTIGPGPCRTGTLHNDRRGVPAGQGLRGDRTGPLRTVRFLFKSRCRKA